MMKIIGQRRLDDYKSSKNVEKLMNMVESLSVTINIESRRDTPKTSNELSFLNNLIREYSDL